MAPPLASKPVVQTHFVPILPRESQGKLLTTVKPEQAGRALLDRLLPSGIPARKAWTDNIFAAFTQLKIPYEPQYFCAVLAIAEQESGFNPDPVIPNFSAIVWQQIEEHRKKYMTPRFVIDTAMLKRSPDGRNYQERINALCTNLRDEVFSLRGSVYFGTAILLQYVSPYDQIIYRFADYNAGRFSSCNAAFQAALARLTERKLALDGDLMLYRNKMYRLFSGQASETQKLLMGISGRLQMRDADILKDLKQEKRLNFSQTTLYQRIFLAADRQAGQRVPREMIPQIVLVSPKFTRKLTTEWFAKCVDNRYRQSMERGGFRTT